MNRLSFLLLFSALTMIPAAAAGIDGKWSLETNMPAREGAEATTITQTLDLKAEGNVLKGTITSAMPNGRSRSVDIQEGKVNGNKFSFKVVNKTRRGENTTQWEGAVEGNELKGTRTGQGGRSTAFVAKKV